MISIANRIIFGVIASSMLAGCATLPDAGDSLVASEPEPGDQAFVAHRVPLGCRSLQDLRERYQEEDRWSRIFGLMRAANAKSHPDWLAENNKELIIDLQREQTKLRFQLDGLTNQADVQPDSPKLQAAYEQWEKCYEQRRKATRTIAHSIYGMTSPATLDPFFPGEATGASEVVSEPK